MKTKTTPSATLLLALAGLALAALPAQAGPVDLGLAGFAAGDDIEGIALGDVGLRITAAGDVTVIEELGTSTAYGAPNYGSTRLGPDGLAHGMSGFPGNGCVNGLGFADVGTAATNGQPDFTFAFDAPVHSFGVRMLDFGDFNPRTGTAHEVVMTAYDADSNVVATQTLTYTSNGLVNPTSGTFNDAAINPIYAGDACWAGDYADITSKPVMGIYNWGVTDEGGAGIASIDLEFISGWDPKIGFDTISFVEFEPAATVDFCAGKDTVVGTVTASRVGDSVCVDYDTVDGWEMSETHTHVGVSVSDFPLTKSGSPKIGRFGSSEAFDESVTAAGSYCFDLGEMGWTSGSVTIGAHAVVADETSTETAWAGCETDGTLFRAKGSWATTFTFEP